RAAPTAAVGDQLQLRLCPRLLEQCLEASQHGRPRLVRAAVRLHQPRKFSPDLVGVEIRGLGEGGAVHGARGGWRTAGAVLAHVERFRSKAAAYEVDRLTHFVSKGCAMILWARRSDRSVIMCRYVNDRQGP